METYQLFTQGKLVRGKEQHDVFESLRGLKFPEASLSAMASGKEVRLKRGGSWEQIKSLQKRLLGVGLKTTVRLEFTEKAFFNGLESVSTPIASTNAPVVASAAVNRDSPRNHSTPNDTKEHSVETDTSVINTSVIGTSTASTSAFDTSPKTRHWLFSKNQVTPSAVAIPADEDITTLTGTVVAKLSSHRVLIKPFFLFLLMMLVGMAVQFYAIRFMTSYLHWQSAASVIGIVILFLWASCVPRLIQPTAFFSIQVNDVTLFLKENARFYVGAKEYAVFDDEGFLIGEIHRSHSAANFFNIEGESIYSWSKKSRPAFDEDDAADVMSGAMLTDNLLGDLFDGIEYLQKAKQLIIKPLPAEQIDWSQQDSLVFTDHNNKAVGRCFTEPYPAVEFKHSISDDDTSDTNIAHLVLFATALILPGVL